MRIGDVSGFCFDEYNGKYSFPSSGFRACPGDGFVRVLVATYPLAPVGPDTCGGTEQVAWLLLQGLAADPELEITWLGAAGSSSIPNLRFRPWVARTSKLITPPELSLLVRDCSDEIVRCARAEQFDLVHSLGALFYRDAARIQAPVLFSLHLARELYPSDFTGVKPFNLHFHCVSRAQWAGYGAAACCGVIPNGIAVDQFNPRRRQAQPSSPLLFLGRICREKGPDLAIALARRLRRRLILVGEPGPFPAHRQYFEDQIAPNLGECVSWLPPPSLSRKLRLLRQAAAVLICSRVEETSSMVAMEAAASGVPVLALRRGTLPEIVVPGVTGWLGEDIEELANMAAHLGVIEPAACRSHAEKNFQVAQMVDGYRNLYRNLAQSGLKIEMHGGTLDSGGLGPPTQSPEYWRGRPRHGQLRPERPGLGVALR